MVEERLWLIQPFRSYYEEFTTTTLDLYIKVLRLFETHFLFYISASGSLLGFMP